MSEINNTFMHMSLVEIIMSRSVVAELEKLSISFIVLKGNSVRFHNVRHGYRCTRDLQVSAIFDLFFLF